MKTLLIVDDEINLCRLYEKQLSKEGYNVVLAHSGAEAMTKVNECSPDLVVLDIRMPGMDGIETLSKILGKNNRLPVILNSAFSSYQNNYMSWAADAYVIKSSDLTELKSKIKEILDKKIS
ncbi:MAG: response regulator [Acidobacteria bacterium]|nr:response regulator [Acidobacteriota bacterium]MBI3654923.1 response regulator [Acidobacteriota bacterium]